LIERVEDFQAHEDERGVHQIKAKMHGELENQILLAARADFAARPQPNSICVAKGRAPDEPFVGKTNSSWQLKTEGFRRRGSDALVANLFLTGGLLFDASFLPVHAP